MLLERPPGNEEAGNFSWKADFEYSLPFQYILPLGCPSSFEGPDGFVRYFTRVTFETSGSKAVITCFQQPLMFNTFRSTWQRSTSLFMIWTQSQPLILVIRNHILIDTPLQAVDVVASAKFIWSSLCLNAFSMPAKTSRERC